MSRAEMVQKIYEKYKQYGVPEEEITYMVDNGFDNDLETEYIMQNIMGQLDEEYKGE